MNYLQKDGDCMLERSENLFGYAIDEEGMEDLIKGWGLDRPSSTGSDKTTHFVVSFPAGTDHDAAYRAGRAWAEEMFALGNYGDVFDYYTAFHTDRAHPHIHVVVNRRGMEMGNWLKVSKRSAFNYDELRAVQVEVAAREGIDLDATPRLARGLSDRPVPDAVYRQAINKGREPVGPSHTERTAFRAAATMALYAAQYTTDAKLVRSQYPDLAKTLREMAATLLAGQPIEPASAVATERAGSLTTPNALENLEKAKQQSEFIMSRRNEILAGIAHIDAEIETLPIGKARSLIERDAERIKANAAKHMPDVVDLTLYTRPNPDGFYQGVTAEGGVEKVIKERADSELAKQAEKIGLDPDRIVSRYDRPTAASIGLADRWRKDELEDIQKNLSYQDNKTPRQQFEPLAQAAYDDLHRNALQTYRKAERELEAHAARKRELSRIAKLIRQSRLLSEKEQSDVQRAVKQTLTPTELNELEAGRSDVLKHVTDNPEEQRALSRQYLQAEQVTADDGRKQQLAVALKQIDKEAQLATERAAEQVRRSRDSGLEL